jgi:hypothetical protein
VEDRDEEAAAADDADRHAWMILPIQDRIDEFVALDDA